MRAVSGHNYFRKFRKGFSLIELVCVIVLLGILASAAAPKYMALQRDARIARLEALKGALKSADSMIMAKAAVQGITSMLNRIRTRVIFLNITVLNIIRNTAI